MVAFDCARLDGPTGQAQKNPQPAWLVWCLARLVQCGFREQFRRCSILLKVVGTHGGKVPCGAGHHRRELEVQLSELMRHDPKGTRGKVRGRRPMGSVPPKYRNPKDPSQTWAGRGLQPHWVRDALKSGKKLDGFLIAKAR